MQTIKASAINIVTVGPFGRSVARHLTAFGDDVTEIEASDQQMPPFEKLCRADANVLASWRPSPQLCQHLDQFSRKGRLPFVPLMMEGSVLRLGPIVISGEGGCWLCWTRRSVQHAATPKERNTILEFYSSNPDAGPQGYLEPFARLGAVKLKQTIDLLRSSSGVAGHIWQIDMITRQILDAVVIGIHDCPHCGLRREGPTRSIGEIRRHLAAWWGPAENGDGAR